ncbi:MAG: hypothetical protein HYT94_02995 [Parcubacteria group bacterium]|nr:hypothetical protein [Parcubacteria group bacterium]
MTDEKNEQKVAVPIISDPARSVPKYSTQVTFAKLQNGDIIMRFLSRTGEENQDKTPAVLIETIMVDETHAKEILKVLGDILQSK